MSRDRHCIVSVALSLHLQVAERNDGRCVIDGPDDKFFIRQVFFCSQNVIGQILSVAEMH